MTPECYKLSERKYAPSTIVPRSNAGYWKEGYQRNDAFNALEAGELKQWKEKNHYHQQTLSETAVVRYKQLISSKLNLRDYDTQVVEALAGMKA